MTTTFGDTYEIKALIGRGGMSTVYLAEHKRLHTRPVQISLLYGIVFQNNCFHLNFLPFYCYTGYSASTVPCGLSRLSSAA